MENIRSGKLTMRPRWHFIMLAGLTAAGLTLLGLAAIFLINVVFWDERQGYFPWLVLGGALVCLAGALRLAKRYDFSYKVRLIVLTAIALVLSGSLGYALSNSGLNKHLENTAPFKPLYKYQRREGSPGSANSSSQQKRNGSDNGSGQQYQKNKP